MNDSVKAVLATPGVEALLDSAVPARLAYSAADGSPRVQPIWFHWNGSTFVLGTGPDTPKARALRRDGRVALSIDTDAVPYRSLQVRGQATVEIVPGVPTEYELAATRYYGAERGARWVESILARRDHSARIEITPTWAHFVDMKQAFPAIFAD